MIPDTQTKIGFAEVVLIAKRVQKTIDGESEFRISCVANIMFVTYNLQA